MKKGTLAYTVALAPLLIGAAALANVGTVSSGLTVDKLPACAEEEFIIYKNGGLGCGPVSTGNSGLTIPDCTGKLLTAVKSTGELPPALQCTNKGQGSTTAVDMTKVTTYETKVTNLGTIITDIKNNPPTPASVYVGNTDTMTNGKITRAGSDTGLPAAHALCADKYAGSHMCSVYEMYASVEKGVLKSGTARAQKAWIFNPGWNGGGETPTAGLSDNCGSYTYPTGDKAWQGIAFSWEALTTASFGLRLHGGAAATCASSLPIACCK